MFIISRQNHNFLALIFTEPEQFASAFASWTLHGPDFVSMKCPWSCLKTFGILSQTPSGQHTKTRLYFPPYQAPLSTLFPAPSTAVPLAALTFYSIFFSPSNFGLLTLKRFKTPKYFTSRFKPAIERLGKLTSQKGNLFGIKHYKTAPLSYSPTVYLGTLLCHIQKIPRKEKWLVDGTQQRRFQQESVYTVRRSTPKKP